MTSSLVDIVIPIYGQVDFLRRCVNAVMGYTYIPYSLWLVDDFSPTDDTRRYMASIHDPRVRAFIKSRNTGFGDTCNIGASLGSAPFICFLNSDTEPTDGWLETMLANFNRDRVAIVGPKMVYMPGEDRLGVVPGAVQCAGIFFGVDRLPREIGRNLPTTHFIVNRRIKVSAVTGACLLIRRALFQGFHPIYRTGCFEDVDLCMEIMSLGYDCVYEPDAVVYHWQGASYDHSLSKTNLEIFMSRWRHVITPNPQVISPSYPTLPKEPPYVA